MTLEANISPMPAETILAVSAGDETVVEFKSHDGVGIMTMEASCVTLSCKKEEGGRLVVRMAPNSTMRTRVVHPMKPGESIRYRVCPAVKFQRRPVEWQTLTAPVVQEKPFWKRWLRREDGSKCLER